MKYLVLAVALALVTVGCDGGAGNTQATDTGTTTAPAATTRVKVYWLRDGKVWPALREVEETQSVASVALEELFAGPTTQEKADLDFTTAIPDADHSVGIERLAISGEVANYSSPRELTEAGLAQVVYTLTQFPTVE